MPSSHTSPRVGRSSPASKPEQRRLARARRADDGDRVARIDRETDVVENRQRRLAAGHDLGELRRLGAGAGSSQERGWGACAGGKCSGRAGERARPKERHPATGGRTPDSTVPLAAEPRESLQSEQDSTMAIAVLVVVAPPLRRPPCRSSALALLPWRRARAPMRARRRCSSSAIRSPRPTGSPPGTGWVDLLAARLAAQKLPYRVVNASITGDTTAGGRARLPALLATHKPAIVVIELGGNDGLRGGNLASTRDNLAAMVAAVQGADAKPLIVGMKMPPNYGAAYVREFDALFAERRAGAQGAARSVLLRRLRRAQRSVPARSHPSDRGGAAAAPRQRLARAAAAAGARGDDRRRRAAPRRQGRPSSALGDFRERIDVRSPSEFADDHMPGAAEPSGARRRRARAHRNDARAGIGVRRAGAPARRSSRATSRRCSRRRSRRSRATGRRSSTAGAAASAAARSRTC